MSDNKYKIIFPQVQWKLLLVFQGIFKSKDDFMNFYPSIKNMRSSQVHK